MKSKSLLVLVAAIVTGACGCGGGPRSTLAITMILPTSAPAGGAAFVLAVDGTSFVPGSVINFGSMPITPGDSSATQLSATVPAAAITTAGTVPVTVTNPAGGGTSNAVNFTIASGPYPVVNIFGIYPTGALAGSPGFKLELSLTNFLAGSVVRWNGSDRPTTALTPSCAPNLCGTFVEAQIPASDIAAPGTAAITVFNPAPGAGSSDPVTFAIAAHGVYPSSVAVDPAGKFAYVTNSGSDNVSTYVINTDGTLTFKGTIAAGGNPASVAVDPSDKFAYVANYGDGSVSMYRINADGLLTSIGTIKQATGGTASVTVHPSGKFAYVTNFGSDIVSGPVSTYAINTDGSFTFNATIAAEMDPASVAVDRSGKFAYVANRGGGWDNDPGSLSMYTIDTTTGALSLNGTLSPTTWVNPSVVVVDPSGRFAYLGSIPVSMYSIDTTTGKLTAMGTVDAGGLVTSLAVHPSGNFAYATANCTGFGGICNPDVSPPHVSVYMLNAATGVLASNGTAPTERSPRSIAIDPSGKFAYVANYDSHSISMYTIDAVTGTLTLIGTIIT